MDSYGRDLVRALIRIRIRAFDCVMSKAFYKNLLSQILYIQFGIRSVFFFYVLCMIAAVYLSEPLSPFLCIFPLIIGLKYWRFPMIGVAVALLYFGFYAQSVLESRLPKAYEGVDVLVIGQVSDLPQGDHRRTSFTFNVFESFLPTEDGHVKKSLPLKKLRLSWFRPPEAVEPGQYWEFTVRLKRPRGFANPTGFDYEKWLVSQGYDATGYVRSKPISRLVKTGTSIDSLRTRISEFFRTKIEGQWSSVLPALVVADKQSISYSQWQLVTSLGLNHLLAISGLHVGFVAWAGFLIGTIFQRTMQLASNFRIALQALPAFIGLLAALGYSALAGFSLPTVRAFVMVAVVVFFTVCRRKISLDLLFLLALATVLTVDPLAPLAVGFWLSFAAVGVLLWSLSGRRKSSDGPLAERKEKIKQLCWAQLILWLGMLVPLAATLGKVSLLSPVANLVAVPVVTVLVVPLALLAAFLFPILPGLAIWLGQLAGDTLDILFSLLGWIVQVSLLPMMPLADLSLISCMLAVVGAGLLLLPRFQGSYFLAVALMLPLIAPVVFSSYQQKERAMLTLLDVGQGTALVYQDAGFQLVYDLGKAFSPQFDAGRDIVAEHLWRQGIEQIDMLVLSHGDADHSGGYAGFKERIQSEVVIAGEPERSVNHQFSAWPSPMRTTSGLESVKSCQAGMRWGQENTRVEVLWPTSDHSVIKKSNNRSCVLLLSSYGKRILLVGDIEKSVELKLLKHPSLAEPVDILLVPHHGSRTSSSSIFIRQLQPQYGLVSSGYRNPHGHPHYKVVERYQQQGVTLLNTSEEGALTFSWLENDPLQVSGQRSTYRQWWRSL